MYLSCPNLPRNKIYKSMLLRNRLIRAICLRKPFVDLFSWYPPPAQPLPLSHIEISRQGRVFPPYFHGFGPKKIVLAFFLRDYCTAPVLSWVSTIWTWPFWRVPRRHLRLSALPPPLMIYHVSDPLPPLLLLLLLLLSVVTVYVIGVGKDV